jgi:predicted AlkP superfamily phosphohydrolase/phosphomutase/tetratricopeptide (TPR) repeat protein
MRLPALLLAAVLAFAASGCRDSAADESVSPEVAAAVEKMRAAHPELFRRRVILLGFDSCDPDLVEQYIREGKLPNFARMRREGAYGPLHSIQPTLSPVVWTTIATGMPPQRHGILDFVVKTPSGPVPVSSSMRQADAIWDLLSRRGEKVGVVGWLVTHPAEPVNGFMVTDRIGHLAFEYLYGVPKDAGAKTWPPALAGEIADEIVNAKDVSFSRIRPFLDITQKEYDDSYSENFDARNRVNNLRLTLATAETIRNVGERLYVEEKPRFFACYFEAMDAISHLFMPYSPPKSPHVPADLYMKYRSAVEAAYVWHDRVLGGFMELADPDTTIFVVSDHGFKSGDFRMADSSDFHAKTGAQWHRQYGVFYAWGNGVKRGASVGGASVYDIAPTLLASMGYPVSDEMRRKRGVEPAQVLTDAFEDGLPYETVTTWRGEARRDEMASVRVAEVGSGSPGAQTARNPEEEDQLRKLEALGYTGGDRSTVDTTAMNKVSALLSQGQVDAAYDEAKKLLENDRMPMALDSYAEVCMRKGLINEAEAAVEESLRKVPGGPPALMLRARVLVARGKFEEAEQTVRDALALKSDAPNVWQTLAYVLSARLETAEKAKDANAVEVIRQALIEARESALRLEPRQPQVLVDLARERLAGPPSVESAESARDELTRALEMQPHHITAHNNRAIANLRLAVRAKWDGRTEAADELLKAALADADTAISLALERFGPPGYDKGWANKAYVLSYMGDFEAASAAAAEARKANAAYVFNPVFLAAMEAKGHPVPPPAGK